jgi:hypothetical protein
MNPPRFLLVLAAQENLLRAALVLRNLKIAASAQQTFRVADAAFDPAEVWYKMKQVIAACLDIGRTLPRELITCALVGDDSAWVMWQDRAGEVDSVGYLADATDASAQRAFGAPTRFREYGAPVLGGTCRAWLLWNLSGAYVLRADELARWNARAARCDIALAPPRVCDAPNAKCFGRIRARSPFAEELSIADVFAESELRAVDVDGVIQHAAARVFAQLSRDSDFSK